MVDASTPVFCHPLREDVSWNPNQPLHMSLWLWSSSSWGCELKYCNRTGNLSGWSHPLREDVSWNTFAWIWTNDWSVILFVRMWVEMVDWLDQAEEETVILFVRMWVEIVISQEGQRDIWSSSSWGCELKYNALSDWVEGYRHPLREDVSWNIFHLLHLA